MDRQSLIDRAAAMPRATNGRFASSAAPQVARDTTTPTPEIRGRGRGRGRPRARVATPQPQERAQGLGWRVASPERAVESTESNEPRKGKQMNRTKPCAAADKSRSSRSSRPDRVHAEA